VHIEVGLPDEVGRQQILKIHTDLLVQKNAIESDVNIDELASLTKNFTGAEIESLVKSASSFAFQRVQSVFEFNKKV
jgi:vesicle-fusing ATPase